MSTKIYNGYRIRGTDLPALWQLLKDYETAVRHKADTLIARLAAHMATETVDNAAAGLPAPEWAKYPDNPLGCAVGYILEQHREVYRTRLRNPEYDFGCRLWLYPCRRDVLAILDTEKPDFTRLWKRLPGVEEFGYWNNTDRPKGIGQRAWDGRGDRWEEAMGQRGSAALEFAPINSEAILDWPSTAHVLRAVPSFTERADRVARAILRDKRCVRRMKGKPLHACMRIPREHEEWAESPKGIKAYDATKASVARKLKPTLTASNLAPASPVPSRGARGGGR